MKMLRPGFVALMFAAAASGSLYAQAAPASSPMTETSPVQRDDEILVTANRRAESLQDVGASVMAFSGAQLEDMRVESAGDLAGLTPMSHSRNSGVPGVTQACSMSAVSGRRTSTRAVSLRTTVYIDDFYILSSSAVDFQTDDISTAEILRRPQGTLFGRNSTAGAVVMHTNQPKYILGGSAKVSVGSHNSTGASAVLNIPIVTDRLAGLPPEIWSALK